MRQTLGWFVPDDYPIILTELAATAKVRIPTALMQPHDAVDAAAQQLGDVQIRNKIRDPLRESHWVAVNAKAGVRG